MGNNHLNYGCYNAVKDGEKFMCPICHAKEGGRIRIITHNWDCPNKGKVYCQQPPLEGFKQYGAKRKTMRKQSRRRVKRTQTRSRRR